MQTLTASEWRAIDADYKGIIDGVPHRLTYDPQRGTVSVPVSIVADDPDDGPPHVISTYTRAQAIEDGVLIDAGAVAKEAGFTYPVALTAAVWERCVIVPDGVQCQDEAGRLWDVLWMLRCACRRSAGETLTYYVHVRNTNRQGTPPRVRLKAICGPGDDAAPVLTIMLPDED